MKKLKRMSIKMLPVSAESWRLQDKASAGKVAALRQGFGSGLPSSEKRLEWLRTLKPFVLDNSMREPTVAQIFGHVEEDKDAILAAIDKVGFPLIVAGAFGALERTEDVWLAKRKGHVHPNWVVFSELVDDDVHVNVVKKVLAAVAKG